MPTGSGRYVNWTNVRFTPTGTGSVTTTFNGVTDVSYDTGGQMITFKGDIDRFQTTATNVANDPSFTVSLANKAQIHQYPVGSTGTFAATHLDAANTTGASPVYTMVNAYVSANNSTGSHAQYGNGSITFMATSSDGQTNPVSIAYV